MKEHIFYETEPDADALFDFEPTMFHRISHLYLQRNEGWVWYHVKDEKRSRVVASLFVNIREGVARSAVRSPYGTLECSVDIPHEVLFNFLMFVEEGLRKRSVKQIRITSAPYLYMPAINALLYAYFPNLGYQVTTAELSACLATTGEFNAGISQSEKQALLKAMHAGLDFQLIYIDRLDEIYNFIDRHHGSKDYPLSMTYPELSATVQKFQDRFILSGVFEQNKLVAASIAIRVSEKVLYNFYMDHDPGYDKLKPVLVLLQGLYDYGKEHRIPLLDLGTSALGGKPNFGLLSFKSRLGAELTPKLSFEKIL